MSALVFRSKRDRWLMVMMSIAGCVTLMGVTILARALPRGDIGAMLSLVLLIGSAVLSASVLASTHYTLNDSNLIIRSGPFRWVVPVASIVSVSPTDDPSSSPALSLDRLAIKYRIGADVREILVSPLEKQAFINALAALNPVLAV